MRWKDLFRRVLLDFGVGRAFRTGGLRPSLDEGEDAGALLTVLPQVVIVVDRAGRLISRCRHCTLGWISGISLLTRGFLVDA